jgi:hypothetical protein
MTFELTQRWLAMLSLLGLSLLGLSLLGLSLLGWAMGHLNFFL